MFLFYFASLSSSLFPFRSVDCVTEFVTVFPRERERVQHKKQENKKNDEHEKKRKNKNNK